MGIRDTASVAPLFHKDDSPKHLIVLHHGLWGNSTHMEPVITQFDNTFPSNDFFYLNVNVSEGNLTYDGIDACGERCVDLILKFISEMNLDRISFIGYSLGGLILRYVVGRLYHLRIFEELKPLNFVTIATPHLGTTRPVQFSMARIYNSLQSAVLTRVGPQFTVQDKYFHDTPLLLVMADPNYDFFKGLKLFKSRVVFANIDKDRSVRYTTASMLHKNPYTKYQHTVIDPKYPAIVRHDRTTPKVPLSWWKSMKSTGTTILVVPILVPIWLVVASTALTVAYVVAKNRQRNLVLETSWLEQSMEGLSFEASTESLALEEDFDELDGEIEEDGRNSTLAISNDTKRIRMLEHLNILDWKKVDVFLDAFNSHGAIMRRKPFYKGQEGDAIHYLADKLFLI
jgi:hypothetical protein